MREWHSRELGQLWKELDTGPEGLSPGQAAARLVRFGPNRIREAPRRGRLGRLAGQLLDPMILVLLGAAGLSVWASGGREWLDGAIILAIVGVNSLISLTQADRADRALKELGALTAPTAQVLRGGRTARVPAEELVPGDVVCLAAGDQVPADCRLVECAGLTADESAMTGESLPVSKEAAPALSGEVPLAERRNMVLSGTLITAGRGRGLVCATGMDTEMGRIAGLLTGERAPATPLQRKMGEVSRILSGLCLVICAAMFALGLAQGRDMLEMFLTAVSLAVAAIPEGLPAIVTIVLALGVGRMARRGAIVKQLPAVETLGCAGVICSDKTGTLTQNRMEVQAVWTAPGRRREEVLRCALLCNDAVLRPDGTAAGDPTETALLLAARQEGLDPAAERESLPRAGELPFDSGRKLMSTLHPLPGGRWRICVKGAPEAVLARCTGSPSLLSRAGEESARLSRQALRVLAVAVREVDRMPAPLTSREVERELTLLGLAAMMDPPRPKAARAVERCRRAGVRTVMITGDHLDTAGAVARQLGLWQPGDLALTGPELDLLPQELLEQDIRRVSVFARVTPEHKMRIVRAWQAQGQVVAMTGDGVNDAPALRCADIGCAMGRGGTDVAKSAAAMVLTDDDFSTIVAAVEEGRGIWANISKAIHYLLSCNMGELVTIFAAALLGGGIPLAPVQLLWLDLVTDSFPALALGVEPVEEGVMEEPPRRAGEGLFTGAFLRAVVLEGGMIGGLALLAGWLGGPYAGSTMTFATLTLSQLVHAFNARSRRGSVFALGLTTNPAMVRAFLGGLALQLGVLLVPGVRQVFSAVPLTPRQWLGVAALSLAPLPICEGAKALDRRPAPARHRNRERAEV